ncbi:hypothetical protein [Catellatospora sp. TT07R-123]|uniref:hypothetical protein n=1 Tax=Catellatospora sp. TT07R-123 TaxID=2733863 RepID=UPI001BB4061E|nr:hypothetical protein [Catellatospora sp. TT07R-123]
MNPTPASSAYNPFRHWIDEQAPNAAAACALYDATLLALKAIPDDADTISAAEPILRAFINGLDDLDGEEFLMDTIRREEAGDVFDDLARQVGIPSEISDEWFDEWRDF